MSSNKRWFTWQRPNAPWSTEPAAAKASTATSSSPYSTTRPAATTAKGNSPNAPATSKESFTISKLSGLPWKPVPPDRVYLKRTNSKTSTNFTMSPSKKKSNSSTSVSGIAPSTPNSARGNWPSRQAIMWWGWSKACFTTYSSKTPKFIHATLQNRTKNLKNSGNWSRRKSSWKRK